MVTEKQEIENNIIKDRGLEAEKEKGLEAEIIKKEIIEEEKTE